MSRPLQFIDRKTGLVQEEKIYGGTLLRLLWNSRWLFPLINAISKTPLISRLYGLWKRNPLTKREVASFIKTYEVDASEFEKPLKDFRSFDDFFIRTLKAETRPFASSEAICPADGRYSYLLNVDAHTPFKIKGQTLTLDSFVQDKELSNHFSKIDLVFIRLCPVDYHRFHFPCDGFAHESRLIKGALFSVNPIALSKRDSIFIENRRRVTRIENPKLGEIIMGEIGATFVGSLHETYTPGPIKKGQEKGFFSFGGSAILLAFQSERFSLSSDFEEVKAGRNLEIKSLLGLPLGDARRPL